MVPMHSRDLWVMFRPAEAFQHLARESGGGKWIAVRRPLFLVLLLASCGSLAASGRLSLRLLAGGAECAVFLPLLLAAPLALIRGRTAPLARAIDLFFLGLGPWSLWLLALAAVWAFVPAATAYAWLEHRWAWYLAAMVAFAWCGYIDFWYLRCVFHKTALEAVRDLALQRAVTWTAALAVFLGASGWQALATRFGL